MLSPVLSCHRNPYKEQTGFPRALHGVCALPGLCGLSLASGSSHVPELRSLGWLVCLPVPWAECCAGGRPVPGVPPCAPAAGTGSATATLTRSKQLAKILLLVFIHLPEIRVQLTFISMSNIRSICGLIKVWSCFCD